jgi:hypothetical protein
MKSITSFLFLCLLFFLLTFIQISAEEVISLQLDVEEGDLVMYFVDDSEEYLSMPWLVDFETTNTSFYPIDVQGILGTPTQSLRIDNATAGEVQLSVGLNVEDFGLDAKWVGEDWSFLAYSEDGVSGGLEVDSSEILLLDHDCPKLEQLSIFTNQRFKFMGPDHLDNVESIDILSTNDARECRFDLMNVFLTQTVPPRTPMGNYTLGMVLTLVGGDWGGIYTLEYVAGTGGIILGESLQSVYLGGNGSAIEAIGLGDWIFSKWSDGSVENPRQDLNVLKNISVEAIFVLDFPTVLD